jgi:hypothetical protein
MRFLIKKFSSHRASSSGQISEKENFPANQYATFVLDNKKLNIRKN